MKTHPSPGRPRQVTDDQIFEALARAISEHGPLGFSMNTVAESLGMTGPAIGYRFGSKRQLLQAFAARQPGSTGEYLRRVAEQAKSPGDAIIEGLVGLVAGSTTRSEVANNLAFLHLDLTNEDLLPHAAAQAAVVRKHLEGLLGKAGLGAADRKRVAAELQILWGGVITSWAIDGTGSLESTMRHWIKQVLDREL